MNNIYDYPLKKLEDIIVNEYGQKKFNAEQIFKWVYKNGVTNFDEMSNISLKFREILKREFSFVEPEIYKKQVASDGTIKLLLKMSDGALVETVLMRYERWIGACVSSEVGCNMGCAFCASGFLKRKRVLTAGEMVGQILTLNKLLKEENPELKVTRVVVMGTGEPFDNYDNVLDFCKIINCPHALEIGARHITVSTCGLVQGIEKYANEDLQINLAISLHAPNDEIRHKIMPISYKYPIDDLFEAIKKYIAKTKRKVTLEYILLKGINDRKEDCEELISRVKGMLVLVNLIPYNPIKELKYERSDDKNVRMFYNELYKAGIDRTVRKEFGTDIDAACGQLRAKNEKM